MITISEEIKKLSAEVITAARDKNIKIATAESCTGGLIGGALTAVSGSSDAYWGGVISYDNSVKIDQLNVPRKFLIRNGNASFVGAVSKEVALAMAEGALLSLGTDCAVSVTGMASTGSKPSDKPVGTVWIGIATRQNEGVTTAAHLHSYGDIGRNRVRDATVLDALKHLHAAIG